MQLSYKNRLTVNQPRHIEVQQHVAGESCGRWRSSSFSTLRSGMSSLWTRLYHSEISKGYTEPQGAADFGSKASIWFCIFCTYEPTAIGWTTSAATERTVLKPKEVMCSPTFSMPSCWWVPQSRGLRQPWLVLISGYVGLILSVDSTVNDGENQKNGRPGR